MNKKYLMLCLIGVLAILFGMIVATCVGAKSIPISTVFESLFYFENSLDMQLVRDIRLPRTIATFMVGGLLAMSGAMMQGVTRNSIAEPSIMGMTQGATLAVAITTASSSFGGMIGNTLSAFVGAIIGGILVVVFTIRSNSGIHMTKLLLAGTALSTFFLSLASVVGLLSNRSQELAFWIGGGFKNVDWIDVKLLVAIGCFCVIGAFAFAKRINIVSLGEDVAIGLGVVPSKIRLYVILLIVPICAVCVATAGNIGFIGLIIPHIIRKVIGGDYRKLIPLSFIWGAVLLVWADIVAKTISIPYENPVGIFTALAGVPIFLILVRKEKQ